MSHKRSIMWDKYSYILTAYKQLSAILLCSGVLASFGGVAQAETLNAGFVMSQMNADQRASYVSGVVEGLAFSRYLRERPDEAGMKCIYQWHADTDTEDLHAWFERHPERTISVLLYTMMKRECGE